MFQTLLRIVGIMLAGFCLLLSSISLWSTRRPDAVYYIEHDTPINADTDREIELCLHDRSVYVVVEQYQGPRPPGERIPGFRLRMDRGGHSYPQIGFSGVLDWLFLAPSYFLANSVSGDWHGFDFVRGTNPTVPDVQWLYGGKAPVWALVVLMCVPVIWQVVAFARWRFLASPPQRLPQLRLRSPRVTRAMPGMWLSAAPPQPNFLFNIARRSPAPSIGKSYGSTEWIQGCEYAEFFK